MAKSFDCVEEQHRGGRRVSERLAGLTLDQKVAYWRERTEQLRKRQAGLRATLAPGAQDVGDGRAP
jgi:hypothetical protein